MRVSKIKSFFRFKLVLRLLISSLLLVIILILGSNYWVEKVAKPHKFHSTKTIPHNKVGLVLGTSQYLRSGTLNPFFSFRIDAAVKLYKAGKINYILVSGDNGTIYYNEPITMQRELIKKGIPKEHIYLDYAGFRTLDSVVRAKKVFGQKSITIISQPFHIERALFLAEEEGITAVGYAAKDVHINSAIKTYAREYLARVKAVLDIIFDTQPKHLGDQIMIGK